MCSACQWDSKKIGRVSTSSIEQIIDRRNTYSAENQPPEILHVSPNPQYNTAMAILKKNQEVELKREKERVRARTQKKLLDSKKASVEKREKYTREMFM